MNNTWTALTYGTKLAMKTEDEDDQGFVSVVPKADIGSWVRKHSRPPCLETLFLHRLSPNRNRNIVLDDSEKETMDWLHGPSII